MAGLVLAAGFGAVQIVSHSHQTEKHAPDNSRLDMLMARTVVDDESLGILEAARHALGFSFTATGGVHNNVNPASLIAMPLRAAPVVKHVRSVRKRVMRHYRVSLVYVGGKQRYAVVDGHFCEEGTHLSSGAVVTRIKPGSVLLTQGGLRHWFHVAHAIQKPGHAS